MAAAPTAAPAKVDEIERICQVVSQVPGNQRIIYENGRFFYQLRESDHVTDQDKKVVKFMLKVLLRETVKEFDPFTVYAVTIKFKNPSFLKAVLKASPKAERLLATLEEVTKVRFSQDLEKDSKERGGLFSYRQRSLSRRQRLHSGYEQLK